MGSSKSSVSGGIAYRSSTAPAPTRLAKTARTLRSAELGWFSGKGHQKQIAEAERSYLQAALEKAGGVRTRAADLLKISYRSFRHYAKKHNL